ncbi:MAG: hypothetical protein ACI4QL_02440, partial [Candidatus Fimimonas sp.]
LLLPPLAWSPSLPEGGNNTTTPSKATTISTILPHATVTTFSTTQHYRHYHQPPHFQPTTAHSTNSISSANQT